jgi:microcystin-dependent protein
MATVTAGYNWVSGETVTPSKLNSAAAPTVVVADGEVTVAKLAAAVQQLLVPAGAVQAFAMNSAPTGWLAADGTAVSRSTYAALFAAIGTTYGAGDGSTTFALPDLRGIFVRGSGSQTISGTTYNKTFAAKEGDAIRNITGGLSFGAQMAALQVASGAFTAVTTNQFMPQQATANTLGIGSVNFSATAAGVPTSDENRPANIAMLYCIKF